MSEMATLQRTVASFVEEAGIEAPVEARLLDLVSEVGELSREVLEAALDGALGKYRERLALGDDVGSGQ